MLGRKQLKSADRSRANYPDIFSAPNAAVYSKCSHTVRSTSELSACRDNGLNSDIGVKPVKLLAHVHGFDRQVNPQRRRERQHRTSCNNRATSSTLLPRMMVPSASCTSSGAAARGKVSSAKLTFGPALRRRRPCTQDTNVGYFTPSRFANAFCVNPLSSYARTNASRSAAGVILRPRSSRFISINSVAMVAITTSYTRSHLSPTGSPASRLPLNAFERRLNGFERGLNTFERVLNAFERSPNCFEGRLNGFERALNRFERGLNSFERVLNASGRRLNGSERDLNATQRHPINAKRAPEDSETAPFADKGGLQRRLSSLIHVERGPFVAIYARFAPLDVLF